METPEHIIEILKKTRHAIQNNDTRQLKFLSNLTIHSATISQDADDIILAVLVYSIGKILERDYYKTLDGWKKFILSTTTNIDKAINALEKNKLSQYRNALGRIRNSINKISGNLSEYLKDIFRKARINKAFKIYEHGLSMEQTAKLLGVSLWDLASYIGQSSIHEAKVSISMPIEKRIKIAENFFK